MRMTSFTSMKRGLNARMICLLVSLVLKGQVGSPPRRSEGHAAALGRILGSELVIIRPGQEPLRQRLEFDFLTWAFSPDGKAVIGLARKTVHEDNSPYNIVLSGPFGKGTVYSVGGFSNVATISVSPNNQLVALVATNQIGRFRGLQILDLTDPEPARNAREIQRGDGMDTYLAWSAGSRSLMYSAQGEVRIFELPTGKERRYGPGRMPGWSPDGRWISWIADKKTLVVSESVGRTRRVVRTRREFRSGAIWAPDSTRFIIDEDWPSKHRPESCLGNSRLVEYSVDDLVGKPLWNPCGLKPQLFGFIDDWVAWASDL